MSTMYTVSFKGVAVTAAQDFFQVLAPSNKSVFVHGFLLSQSTETGDLQEEMLTLTTNRGSGSVTDGSGGSTATANPKQRSHAAFGGTIEVNNTTRLAVGTGTLTELEVHNWNERIPYMHWYTPETRPEINGGEYWTLESETVPADSVTISGTLWLEVIG